MRCDGRDGVRMLHICLTVFPRSLVWKPFSTSMGCITKSTSSLGSRGSLTQRAAEWQVIIKVRFANF